MKTKYYSQNQAGGDYAEHISAAEAVDAAAEIGHWGESGCLTSGSEDELDEARRVRDEAAEA